MGRGSKLDSTISTIMEWFITAIVLVALIPPMLDIISSSIGDAITKYSYASCISYMLLVSGTFIVVVGIFKFFRGRFS